MAQDIFNAGSHSSTSAVPISNKMCRRLNFFRSISGATGNSDILHALQVIQIVTDIAYFILEKLQLGQKLLQRRQLYLDAR